MVEWPAWIYTYIALAFVFGVAVGIGLCRTLLRLSEKNLVEARQLLQRAIDQSERATAFYQNAVLETDRGIQEVMRIAREGQDGA